MSFYTPSITHPTIVRRWSGAATAGSAAAPLSTSRKYCANGVWIKNEDADENVRILAPSEPTGFLLTANSSRFFPDDDVSKIFIVRGGSADVAVSYWGG
ncbi:MAG: hypothetical protein ACWGQW_21330 [bacterium]